jgi:multidrug efflux pump subunit AcrA (membrane-fusion protein)
LNDLKARVHTCSLIAIYDPNPYWQTGAEQTYANAKAETEKALTEARNAASQKLSDTKSALSSKSADIDKQMHDAAHTTQTKAANACDSAAMEVQRARAGSARKKSMWDWVPFFGSKPEADKDRLGYEADNIKTNLDRKDI